MRRGSLLPPLLLAAAACAGESDDQGPDRPVSSDDPAALAAPADPARDCGIVDSSEWLAWVNALPGSDDPILVVMGKVRVPGDGYHVSLEPGPLLEKAPPIQILDLKVMGSPESGRGALSTHDVRVEMPAVTGYDSIDIRCGGRTITRIGEVQRAH